MNERTRGCPFEFYALNITTLQTSDFEYRSTSRLFDLLFFFVAYTDIDREDELSFSLIVRPNPCIARSIASVSIIIMIDAMFTS